MEFSERFKLKEEGRKVKWPVVDGKETLALQRELRPLRRLCELRRDD